MTHCEEVEGGWDAHRREKMTRLDEIEKKIESDPEPYWSDPDIQWLSQMLRKCEKYIEINIDSMEILNSSDQFEEGIASIKLSEELLKEIRG